ncbi:ribonucleoside reductase [Theileria orientalis strain Shintoku]|uniref:Ribonucleoside reductase n=1 Tax=Theileria orientalis strain Shintoku TaxID=869250 RepID=J4CCN1_THEOR|nr:ribonucleoside reductase [Theileria orientalis strain Shintoku]PVC52450.1 ribonucleoside reductase [Theileria orientalis]BAM39682.1 ribonucleoside reductase [Theileria orientalis strain Shintoku]|eukprot:XP_009689983.1 ribonucleoside reductase [Theileria orientalis strain Shintoku]
MSAVRTYSFLPNSGLEAVQDRESLLKENKNRWVMFPVEYDTFWAMYKEVENNFWAAEDFIFSEDKSSLDSLTAPLLDCLNRLLSYHVMLDNSFFCRPADITLDLLSDVQAAEARAFYGFQLTDENIHSETVGSMFQNLGRGLDMLSGSDKISWLQTLCKGSRSFFRRILLCVISKLLFSCSFSVLRDFLVKDRHVPTHTSALDAMKTDRHIHVRFAHCVFLLLEYKMLESEVFDLVREATRLEFEFCCNALPLDFMDLSKDHLQAYIEHSANNVLSVSGYKPLFNPDYDVDWLSPPRVDLSIQKQQQSKPIQNEVVTTTEIKFDEDF